MSDIPGSGISGVSRNGASQAARGGRRISALGFSIGREEELSETAAPAPAVPLTLGSMLALQEVGTETVRDRAARRHGHAMLQLLTALQRAMLGGDNGDGATLDRLAALLPAIPVASDVGLRSAVDAVALRVRIELARRGS